MRKLSQRNVIVILATWVPLAFLLGMVWAMGFTRRTPASDAIRSVKDCLLDYYAEHGSLPKSLDLLPDELKEEVRIHRITYDVEGQELSSEGGPYYDYSLLYVVSRGLLGSRSTHADPGFCLWMFTDGKCPPEPQRPAESANDADDGEGR